MGVENIEKYSRGYALLKTYLRFWHDKIFYGKVVYVNREQIPLDEHLIFTPNHQNALMDLNNQQPLGNIKLLAG